MHAENDAGEARGRGMLRAFTEEPEHARLPQEDVEDSDATDEAHEDTDTDYHVRGRQMLRAFTQEPELGQDDGTEEDENEYDGDTSKLNPIDEDESDDDDILYQNSGVIPAKSMAPPPRPPLHKPYQQKPQSTFHAPGSLPRQQLWSRHPWAVRPGAWPPNRRIRIKAKICRRRKHRPQMAHSSPTSSNGGKTTNSQVHDPPTRHGTLALTKWAPEKKKQRRRRKADIMDKRLWEIKQLFRGSGL
jgi:hypothetical protein